MNDFTVLSIDMIVSNPKIRSGRPIIAGTSMRVQDIAIGYLYKGYSVDDLLTHYPHLNRAQIHAALAYYYAHKDEIDHQIDEDEAFYQQAKAQGLDSDIRLYFDENVETAVADQMRARSIECVTVRDLNLLGDADENHLQRAGDMGYVLCTYDADYPRLHREGFPHTGIVFAIERSTSIGDWVRGLELICGAMTADEMKNHIEYLS